MLANQQKSLDDIEQFGCTVIHVIEEENLPPFSYTVGIFKELLAPEVVVVGMKQAMAHFMVNEYNSRVRAGERFKSRQPYSGFLEGFSVVFEPVELWAYEEYFGQAQAFYGSDKFEVLQMVYPNTDGIWPWDDEAPSRLVNNQPLLSRARHG